MPLLRAKNNKFKSDPPKIRVEKIRVDKPLTKAKSLSPLASSSTSSRASPAGHRPSPRPVPGRKSHPPLPPPTTETEKGRKRKDVSARILRQTPVSVRIAFDKDSDVEDDGWMTLDSRKRQRKSATDGSLVDPNRKLRSSRAFKAKIDDLPLVDAVAVASLETKCVPIMGAQREDVAIEIQYPSLQRREK